MDDADTSERQNTMRNPTKGKGKPKPKAGKVRKIGSTRCGGLMRLPNHLSSLYSG